MSLEQRLKAIKDAIVAQSEGKEFMPLALAANIASCHVNTLRRAVAAGALRASRRAANGPITIWAADLAHWICAGEAMAAPSPVMPRARKRRRKQKYDDGGVDPVVTPNAHAANKPLSPAG